MELIAVLHQSVGGRAAVWLEGLVYPVKWLSPGEQPETRGCVALREELECQLLIPEECRFTGALGAALMRAEWK